MQSTLKIFQIFVIVGALSVSLVGCAAIAVVDTAITVTSVAVKTTAKVTGAVVGATIDGVRAISKKNNKK